MKYRTVIFISLFFSFYSFAYWEWTPKTGRWINPKYAVKDTPKEQFEWAEQLRKEGNTEGAILEHEKLLKHYSNSEYAASSCFILGEMYQSKGDNKKAFDYYQKIVDKYPSSPLLTKSIERQAKIAEKEIKKGSGWLFFKERKEERGEMLATVIENHPYAEDSAKRAIELGKFYLETKQYKKAKDVFSDITMKYTSPSILEEAHFYLIKTEFLSVPEVSTDIKQYAGVKKRIETFLALYKDSIHIDEVIKIKNKIMDNEAKKYFDIASFYEKSGKSDSARYYYKILAENYPETSYGKDASKKLRSNN
ncbi:MAG: tetratricopeptide repeat protein [Candidatus Omnitrophica bacterium]|nr:tetratricopeptide repeat protein [Candidatus Omnitrophota bacterium]MCM8777082.1 tetratricopeptide repeat protein [Candidatus Omnitrophota bacterium]